MKQKKKPKEQLIKSLLDDLKGDGVHSVQFGTNGVEVQKSDSESIELDSQFIAQLHPESEIEPINLESLENPDLISLEPTNSIKANAEPDDDKTSLLGQLISSEAPGSHGSELNLNLPIDASEEETNDGKTLVAVPKRSAIAVEPKTSFGGGRGKSSSFESQFSQAENLKIAQQRILELEREVEKLRKENEMFSSAHDISKQKIDDLISKIQQLDRQKHDLKEMNESELQIFKEGLLVKDSEISRLRSKVEELESRLANDLRKVRVRERELENRLELSKAEKTALLRAKDETILELKRKTDHFQNEIENYQNKIIDLGQKIESNQEQFARTVRALRIALTNLEVSDGTSSSITLAPVKKAE